MNNDNMPRYGLGPRPKRLVGTTLPPHYVFVDSAATNALHDSFPLKATKKSMSLLFALSPNSGERPFIFVTTPLEPMVCDATKGKVFDGVHFKPKVEDLARLGWGQLSVESYGGLRTDLYLIQPFTIADVSRSIGHRAE